MSIVGGDDELRSASATLRNRIKFLCSHGGRILPRPVHGELKYVGGETRVIYVLRDISFIATSFVNMLTYEEDESSPPISGNLCIRCNCGDFAKKLTSRTPKNPNRKFWGCPNYDKATKNSKCGFFRWDDMLESSSSSSGPSTPPTKNFLSSSSGGCEENCSNCKLLSMKIKILEAKLESASQSAATLLEGLSVVE